MVDMVVNFAASLSTDTSAAALAPQNLTFKKPEHYHPLCWIDYNSQDSVERCWMGDGYVPLMDYNTENAEVQNTLNLMIQNLVSTYGIDGLRIDGNARSFPSSRAPSLTSLVLQPPNMCLSHFGTSSVQLQECSVRVKHGKTIFRMSFCSSARRGHTNYDGRFIRFLVDYQKSNSLDSLLNVSRFQSSHERRA